MNTGGRRQPRGPAPQLQRRTVVFGVLLALFALGMLIAGLGIGVTTVGLPPEQHPCLLFKKRDLETVRARVDSAPYRQWHDRLLRLVDEEDHASPAGGAQWRNAQRAKALAFAFVLTGDRSYGDRAAELLRLARSPDRGGRWLGLDDIVEGAAAYAIAYDLMAGYLRSHETLDAKTRLLLYELGEELNRGRYMWPSPGGDTRTIRQFSALGLVALAISDYDPPDDRPRSRDWHRRAVREVLEALRRQVCHDGAYAEGPGRHLLAAKLYLPFFAAARNVTGENHLSDQALAACEWTVRIRMPGGLRPNVDSSPLTPSISYALTRGDCDPRLFRWDAQMADLAHTVPDDQLPEALAFYDHTAPLMQEPPWPPSHILEGSGDIVFRSGWDRDATYLLLRGERGKARTAGGAYEHPDGTSIILCKGDEILVHDTGYGGWMQREETADAAAHSLVLINDKGPPVARLGGVFTAGVDTEAYDLAFTPVVDAARVRRRHHGAVFDRTVIFADKRDVIIFDHALAQEGEHDFNWRLHVNAGAATEGTLRVRGNTALATRPAARLQVVMHSSTPTARRITPDTGVHYFHLGQRREHAVLESAVNHRRAADFLAVLSPLGPGQVAPAVTPRTGNGWIGVTVGDTTRAAFRVRDVPHLSDGPVRTDGQALCWSTDSTGELQWALAMGAHTLWVRDQPVWSSRTPDAVVWTPRQAAPETEAVW